MKNFKSLPQGITSTCIKRISIYRSELMGAAILWIMMLHFTFTQIAPFGFIAQYGFAGVEIFMMVSGFGLFFSLDKDGHVIRFYRKRLFRIFPTYYVLGVFASLLLFEDNILTFLFRYTTIGFWTGGAYWEWYIPSIVMLYLWAPFLKTLFDKRQFRLISVIAISSLLLAWYFVDKEQLFDRSHFFFLYRIPAFIFGMTCAYWLKNGIPAKNYWIILIVGIPIFSILYPNHHQVYNYKYYSLIFLLPLFTLCLTTIFKYLNYFNIVLSRMGKASLEIYLIQTIFFHATIHGMLPINESWHDTITIALIIGCSLLGLIAHWLIDKSGINRLF